MKNWKLFPLVCMIICLLSVAQVGCKDPVNLDLITYSNYTPLLVACYS
jgi:hypothetical protein